MYIILGEDAAKQLDSKYLVLELDTIRYQEDLDPIKSFCVIDSDHIPLVDITSMDQWINLHSKLIENYRKQNWDFCINAIEHLNGTFKGELDTFYEDIEKRCQVFKQFPPGDDWDGVIVAKNHPKDIA